MYTVIPYSLLMQAHKKSIFAGSKFSLQCVNFVYCTLTVYVHIHKVFSEPMILSRKKKTAAQERKKSAKCFLGRGPIGSMYKYVGTVHT